MSGAQQITNPNQAFGYTDFQNQVGSFQLEFKTSAAITAPKVVSINTSAQVATSATNGTASLQIGVAIKSAASGATTGVVVFGLAENVPCDGAVAAGDRLIRSVTTAGSVAASATPAAGEVIGFAINASSSNTVDVFVCKSLATS